ncbi:hypothetical protein V1281_007847 [Nitrobacteraceae bacterium AZCC 2161]
MARSGIVVLKMSLRSIFERGRARIFSVFLAVAFVTCLPAGASAQDAIENVDIGKNEVGAPPAGFELLPSGESKQGQWRVVQDATATAGLAIEQAGLEVTEDRFPFAIYKTASLTNVEISLRLKATGGKIDQGGGVAVRLMAPDNYYLVQVDALRDRVLLSRVTNGVSEEIVGVDADVASHAWHTLAVRAEDDRISVSFDGNWMFTGYDKTLSHAGRIALWTKGDSVTRFDNISISPLSALEQRY